MTSERRAHLLSIYRSMQADLTSLDLACNVGPRSDKLTMATIHHRQAVSCLADVLGVYAR